MIGEYLESVKTELEREINDSTSRLHPAGDDRDIEIWIVDDMMMPREPTPGTIRGILEAEVGDDFPDNTRTLNPNTSDVERVLLLDCSTTLRLEVLLGDFVNDDDTMRNPHAEMMTFGSRVLNWLKDASFKYQADACSVVNVTSEIDLLNTGFSVVVARWNATVVSHWEDEIVSPRITGVTLNVTATFGG